MTVWPFFQTSAVSPHGAGHTLVWVAEDTNLGVSVVQAMVECRHLFESETNKPKLLKQF